MTHHLTYLEAVVTGLVQGVTELFPVSSLGHNVLLPALIGGNWASALNVSAPGSPYLAFIVGLHVATAIAMIAYFWRDWLRIVRGFISSISQRRVETADERLAWMIILGTIPVGIVGVLVQTEFTKVFAKPELAAAFLAVNGVILLVSERMRRTRNDGAASAATAGVASGGAGAGARAGGARHVAAGGTGYAGRETGGPGGAYPQPPQWNQQPRQQQWHGPGYGDDDWQRGQYGQDDPGRDPWGGQRGAAGGQYGQDQYGRSERYGQGQQAPWDGQPDRGGWDAQDPRARQQAQDQDAWAGQSAQRRDPRGGRDSWNEPARRAAATPVAHAESEGDTAVAADRRLAGMGNKRAILIGAAQILALLPGISRDGIVTVAGMTRGLRREDAVRFSFLLSAPVILAAGVLKAGDLTGPMAKGIHGPVLVGSLIAGVGAYVSIRFLTKYFSEDKSLNPFGIYCLIAGLGSLAYLVMK
jgi:undecaprenyl-diphosphatase